MNLGDFFGDFSAISGDFMKTKKYRTEIPYTGAKPERLDLCYVSENEGFRFSPNTHFWGGEGDDDGWQRSEHVES